jgi:hypothetical protein
MGAVCGSDTFIKFKNFVMRSFIMCTLDGAKVKEVEKFGTCITHLKYERQEMLTKFCGEIGKGLTAWVIHPQMRG